MTLERGILSMRNFWMKGFAALLCLAIIAGGANAARWFKLKAQKEVPVKKSILVFPYDVSSDVQVSSAVGKATANESRDSLLESGKYSVIVYNEKLAAIQRAVQVDRSLNQKELTGPYSEDKDRAIKIAKTTNADYFMVGSIETYSFDSEKKIVSITLSAQLIETKTGIAVSAFSATGKSEGSSKANSLEALVNLAMADGVKKLELDKVKLNGQNTQAAVGQ